MGKAQTLMRFFGILISWILMLLMWFLADQTVSAQSQNVEVVGHVGGICQAVTTRGNRAFMGQGTQLSILDISNPLTPAALGGGVLPEIPYDIFATDTLACVATGSSGVQVVDIGNISKPCIRGTYGAIYSAEAVAIAGKLATVIENHYGDDYNYYESLLRVVDISNPAAPSPKGSYNIRGWAYDVVVRGNLAYVASDYYGLLIVNISDPAKPSVAGSLAGSAIGISISGNLAYVTDYYEGLKIIDISNPAKPILKGSCTTPGVASGVSLSGNLALIADQHSGLQVINVSSPAAPALVGSYDSPGFALSVASSGTAAYLADGSGGLKILDITTPTTPVLRSTYGLPGTPKGVAVSGKLAFIASGERGLNVVDVANPAAPLLRGTLDTPGSALGVVASGALAYVADGESGLQIISAANPAKPARVGSCDTPVSAQGIARRKSLVYIADDAGMLQIIDVYDPANPWRKGEYRPPFIPEPGTIRTGERAYGVAVSGDYAYLAHFHTTRFNFSWFDYQSLSAIDISNSSAPVLRGSCGGLLGWAYGVACGNGAAYVPSIIGLKCYSLSNPSAPAYRGSWYEEDNTARAVAASGGLVYAGFDKAGLRILDMSAPTTPTLVGSYPSPKPSGITLANGLIYLTDEQGGLSILQYTGPAPAMTAAKRWEGYR